MSDTCPLRSGMNSLDSFSVRALMRMLEHIHATRGDLEVLLQALFAALEESNSG
jgi:hypothetical protein